MVSLVRFKFQKGAQKSILQIFWVKHIHFHGSQYPLHLSQHCLSRNDMSLVFQFQTKLRSYKLPLVSIIVSYILLTPISIVNLSKGFVRTIFPHSLCSLARGAARGCNPNRCLGPKPLEELVIGWMDVGKLGLL